MKYWGKIGYSITKEVQPSVWVSNIIERNAVGDVLKFSSRRTTNDSVNSDVNISNRISIVADPFTYENAGNIAYISWLGTRWSVTEAEVDPDRLHRLILNVGGVYNGEQA